MEGIITVFTEEEEVDDDTEGEEDEEIPEVVDEDIDFIPEGGAKDEDDAEDEEAVEGRVGTGGRERREGADDEDDDDDTVVKERIVSRERTLGYFSNKRINMDSSMVYKWNRICCVRIFFIL